MNLLSNKRTKEGLAVAFAVWVGVVVIGGLGCCLTSQDDRYNTEFQGGHPFGFVGPMTWIASLGLLVAIAAFILYRTFANDRNRYR